MNTENRYKVTFTSFEHLRNTLAGLVYSNRTVSVRKSIRNFIEPQDDTKSNHYYVIAIEAREDNGEGPYNNERLGGIAGIENVEHHFYNLSTEEWSKALGLLNAK